MSYIPMIVNWVENRITFGGSDEYQKRQTHDFAKTTSPASVRLLVDAILSGNKVLTRKALEDLRCLAKFIN